MPNPFILEATDHPICSLCFSKSFLKYSKISSNNIVYNVYNCKQCKQWQIVPIPSEEELRLLYADTYFSKRTDRGYNDYKSLQVSQSIISTIEKNLQQLDFYNWESKFSYTAKALDVGCAGGYFVEYLHNRKWKAEGIDVATTMVEYAQSRNLNVYYGDFLTKEYQKESFDLITLWATIEHLRDPSLFLKRIAMLLTPDGVVYISTCHLGFWAKIRGIHWRYLNVPEHIWYFSYRSLQRWASNAGLKIDLAFTYGSGFTTRSEQPFWYSVCKRIADSSAKKSRLGDMIVCKLSKV